jgi:phage baseplate assembly protein W|tara:strand:- start:2880 stop:3377 length:498 start_codon:yes stop_codon:yes gene_type:complete
MAVTRRANTKQYDFKSTGTSFERQAEIDSRRVRSPPVGIKTPVSLGETGQGFLKMNITFADQIHDNLINLILTNHGERLGLPRFGANLMELAFEMQHESGANEAMKRITQAVNKWMPFVALSTFEPVVELFENKQVAKVGVKLTYSVPRIKVKERGMEVIVFSAG